MTVTSTPTLVRRDGSPFRRYAALAFGFMTLISAQSVFAFGFDDVADQARSLADQGYNAPQSNLPDSLSNLEYQKYSQIQFKPQYSLWRGDNLPFDLSFFHEGMHYNLPVTVNQVVGDDVSKLQYEPQQFDFSDSGIDPSSLPDDLGYAGFRVNYALQSENKQEVMAFLGASYFRVVGANQRYGVSARGLAIDTALSSGEEFPRFKNFWVVKPDKGDKYLTIYALLDSPSATGAYRFVLRPGQDSIVDVKSKLFLRRQVTKLGIAPLTSMYLFGPSQPSDDLNFRPAIHDSNGLLVNAAQGDWLWHTLMNPKKLMVSTYPADNPRGFGLMQRNHEFGAYQDLQDRYDLRLSAWIEPQGSWGKGQVELVEIPTPNETNDNIVSYWRPTGDLPTDQGLEFDYRINWTKNEARYHTSDLGWVAQARRSQGEVRQGNLVRKTDDSTMFVLDFVGPEMKSLDSDDGVKADISLGDNGNLVRSSVEPNPAMGGYRLRLSVKAKDGAKPVDIKALLRNGQDQPLTETWSYTLPANG
ncbi:glucan biosynthesis protein G [Kushneria sinocarnis]|uniref:glucan biosynthesis protein G n=1 Tax=Kushneria sinocarnis TaxID=595502 RepID=UPI001FE7054F|nr:glucan biosynthesis protein G [Kushneria sinocarnis]